VLIPRIEAPDALLERAFGPGKSRKLKSWGHRGPEEIHWLATRSGTPFHTDPAYPRYTHHLIIRNDGFRLRGVEDRPDATPLTRGTAYCLDAHSPHQVVPDPRLIFLDKPVYKLQVALDDHDVWDSGELLLLLQAYLNGVDPSDGIEEVVKAAPAKRSAKPA
jgi:hypothetical protein